MEHRVLLHAYRAAVLLPIKRVVGETHGEQREAKENRIDNILDFRNSENESPEDQRLSWDIRQNPHADNDVNAALTEHG